MRHICGDDRYLVRRNEKTRVTMVENKVNRTIFPIDDKDWPSFVQMVLMANKTVIREMEEGKDE